MKKQAGYVYVECLLGIFCISLIAAYAWPVWRTYENRQYLAISAQQVASSLRYVQQEARNVDAAYRVRPSLSYAGNRYAIVHQTKASYRYLPRAISFASSGEIYFDYDTSGKPISSEKTVTLISKETGERVQVIVQAQSGRVRISWP